METLIKLINKVNESKGRYSFVLNGVMIKIVKNGNRWGYNDPETCTIRTLDTFEKIGPDNTNQVYLLRDEDDEMPCLLGVVKTVNFNELLD